MGLVNVCVCAGRVMADAVSKCMSVCGESDAVSKYEYVRGNVRRFVNVCVCVCKKSIAISKCLCWGILMRLVNVCACRESDAVSKFVLVPAIEMRAVSRYKYVRGP